MVDALGRRGRFERISTGKRLTLQERDWLWLEWLQAHGPLSTSFLLQAAKDLGSSEKRAKERLTDLFNEENTAHGGAYLDRPRQQLLTIDSRYNELVYDLAPAGKRALMETGRLEQSRDVATGPWLHNYMVSCITASIELEVRDRSDLTYIQGVEILRRAQTELAWLDSKIERKLKPDGLFGLTYLTKKGPGYRFFVLEADRSTEPLTTRNFNRKSVLRSLRQYHAYVAEGGYRNHLKLTSPLLVLNVCSEAARAQKMRELVAREYPDGNSYMLFQSWEAFATPFRPPPPNPNLLTAPWLRGGLVDLHIDRV